MDPTPSHRALTHPGWTIALAAFFVGWLFVACAPDWIADENYAFGWLAAALAVFFFLGRWSSRPSGSARVPWVAFAGIFGVAAFVLPIELFRLAPIPWRTIPWLIYAGAVVVILSLAAAVGGPRWVRHFLFPCVFLATVVPWPTAIEQRVVVPLMDVVSGIVAGMLMFLGTPAVAHGATIQLATTVVGVEEACSGLRAFQASFMVALAAGEFAHLPAGLRIVLVAYGALCAFVTNVLRTFVLAMAANSGGAGALENVHDAVGLASSLLSVAFIALPAWILRRPSPSRERAHPRPFPRAAAIALSIAAAGLVLAQAWYAVGGSTAVPERPLLALATESVPLPRAFADVLLPTEGAMAPASGRISGAYHLFWRRSGSSIRALFHRPDVCMPGAGWRPSGPTERVTLDVAGRATAWYVFRFRRMNVNAILVWCAWVDGEPVEFDFRGGVHLQRSTVLDLVRMGRRSVTVEIAAVLVGTGPEGQHPPDLEAVVSQVFRWNDDPPLR